MRTFPLLFLLLLGVAACDGAGDAPSPAPALGEPFTLSEGTMETIGEADLAVTFARVLGDNRCPSDVVCVTGGAVTVEVVLSGVEARWTQVDTLSLGADALYPAAAEAMGYRVEMSDVLPYPLTSRTKPVTPRATFLVAALGGE